MIARTVFGGAVVSRQNALDEKELMYWKESWCRNSEDQEVSDVEDAEREQNPSRCNNSKVEVLPVEGWLVLSVTCSSGLVGFKSDSGSVKSWLGKWVCSEVQGGVADLQVVRSAPAITRQSRDELGPERTGLAGAGG